MGTKIQIAAQAELELRRRRKARLENFETQRAYYQTHPVEFFNDRLGIKPETINWSLFPEYETHSWDGTENPIVKILEALVSWKWCGVESATGTGKTYLGALIVFWFLEVFENSLIVTTAPKQDQLSLHIWKEIGRLHSTFNRGELTTLKLRMNSGKDDWIAVGFVAGVKADEDSATKAQGFHAEHMLIILEETPGVPQPIINAFQNTCTSPHNLILAFGNPDHQLDNLHKFCIQEHVTHIRISAYDHPNVVLDDPMVIPGAASLAGIRRIRSKYGEENPLTLSRTRGISPKQAVDALIKVEWCSNAVNKAKQYCNEKGIVDLGLISGEIGLGVDVANSEFGDKAALCYGKGILCYKVEDFQCPNSNQLGHQIFLLMKEQNIKSSNLGIDGVGIGAGTINTLKEYGITDEGVNLQGAAQSIDTGKEENFNNLRSQMWWQAREDLRLGEIAIVDDVDLIADLTTPKFEIKNGKIFVESKEDIKKRLGRSPNKGDSFVYWNWRRNSRNFTQKLKAVSSFY